MKLFREIGLASAMFLVVGNMVGTGIFTTSGLIAQEIGNSPWLVGIWLAGGLLSLTGALCYAQLGARTPRAGGEFAFLYPVYGPLVAFLSGWASLIIGFSGPVAAASLGLAIYLEPYLPLASGPPGNQTVATLVLLAVTTLLSLGLKFGTRLHSTVTLLNLGLLAAFTCLVLVNTRKAGVLHELNPAGAWDLETLVPVASALVLVMFSYSGWNAAAYIAEEIRDPARNLPRSLLLGTALVTILYVGINLAYLTALPLAQLQGEVAVAQLAASAVLPSGEWIVTLLILVSILSSVTAMSIAGPRIYFAMSRQRLFPSWLGEVHLQKKIPLKAIWFQSGIALALVWMGTLRQILLFSGFVVILFSAVTVSALLRSPLDPGSSRGAWILQRVLPWIFVLTSLAILASVAFSHPGESLAGVATVCAGLPVYYYYRKRLGPAP